MIFVLSGGEQRKIKMEQTFTEHKTFEGTDFKKEPLQKGEYENCKFNNCDLSNSDFTDIKIIECDFISCNLSLIKLNKTSFRDARFNGCKMLGLHFENCNEFGLSFIFENCSLDHSSFYRTKIKKQFSKIRNYMKSIFPNVI